MADKAKPLLPDTPPEFRKDVVRAIQAIAAYMSPNAAPDTPPPSPRDCKLAFDWIINETSHYYDAPYHSGDGGAFFGGRRFVGKQIVMAMQIKPDLLSK